MERIVKRDVAFILEESKSWEELHFKLALKGYEFERKGNGAVLKIGEQVVKLSHVSRSSSFSKLEQRLGKYEERKPEVKIFASGQQGHKVFQSQCNGKSTEKREKNILRAKSLQ